MKCPNCAQDFEGERCPNCGRPRQNSAGRVGAVAVLILFVLPIASIGACFAAAGTGQFSFLGTGMDNSLLLIAAAFIGVAIVGLFWMRNLWRS